LLHSTSEFVSSQMVDTQLLIAGGRNQGGGLAQCSSWHLSPFPPLHRSCHNTSANPFHHTTYTKNRPGSYEYAAFTPTFESTLNDCEKRSDAARRAAAAAKPTPKGAGSQQQQRSSSKPSKGDEDEDEPAAAANGGSAAVTPLGSSSGDEDDAGAGGKAAGFDMSKLKAMGRKAAGGPKGRLQARRGTREEEEEKKRLEASPEKKKKVRVLWMVAVGSSCE